jgi:hypothetical protein
VQVKIKKLIYNLNIFYLNFDFKLNHI